MVGFELTSRENIELKKKKSMQCSDSNPRREKKFGLAT